MRIFAFTSILLLIFLPKAFCQTGIIKGKVHNKVSNAPIPYANVVLQGSTIGTTSDTNGYYEIDNLKPGLYNIEVSYLGFKKFTQFEIEVSNARSAMVDIALQEDPQTLENVVIEATNNEKTDESPLSLRTLGSNEIKRSPGGNRDISRVIRSLPGVGSIPSFRNDIIIRGGAPNENRFYLDGIEVPNINHFQTQGSSGGPVGLINVDFVQRVDLYSGAFPANRGNALSSVLEFVQKDGRNDKTTLNGIVGATDFGLTLEGPIGEKTTYIVSARRSYLQYLFRALGLPFLPVYNDFQGKVKHKFNDKHHVTLLGLGAIDDFTLNTDAANKASTQQEKDEVNYILNQLPASDQWNYAFGAKYEYFRTNGNYTLVMSRNKLNNTATKFVGNDDSKPENLLIDYLSEETESKFRLEDYRITRANFKVNYGISYEHAHFYIDEFSRFANIYGPIQREYSSEIFINKWGMFLQASKSLFKEKLTLSLGMRADANDYSDEMRNLADQFSPRFSASWSFAPKWAFNFNTGLYYQLPPYILLGYRNSDTGQLENKENGVTYIQSRHYVAGLEYNSSSNARFTLEAFYKTYDNYPFHLDDSVSIANLGADFGVIGNAPFASISQGRSYGLEFLARQRLFKGMYGLLAYTWVRSEFQDKDGNFAPSSWDNRHLVSLTGGKKFNRDWELGLRWLFSGPSPYTPFNVNETVRRQNWDLFARGIPDFTRINNGRATAFHQLDLRVDKKYYFEKWSLSVFIDIQNIYNRKTTLQSNIDVMRDEDGQAIVDQDNPDFYLPRLLGNSFGSILPTLGIIVEL
ncbi:MAG: carboxypeptidase-like regulatory domain-containing protein [Cyclobacteriaceae bacterium]